MTEGQRKTLHELLDRMIDDGMGYGIVEYAELPEKMGSQQDKDGIDLKNN